MANLTALGISTSLSLANKNDVAAVALSGTYAATVELQREVGAPGSGQWEKLNSWNTANATVAYNWTAQRDAENLRLIITAYTSGTVVGTLTDSVDQALHVFRDPQGNVLMRITEEGVEIGGALRRLTGSGFKFSPPTYQITAAIAITREKHAGKMGIFNVAAGAIATMPLATGTQDEYEFFVTTTITSNNAEVDAAGSDLVQGVLTTSLTGGTGALSWGAGASVVKAQLNGTTKGGIKGSYMKFKDVASGIWLCTGQLVGSGSIVTPFA